MGGREDSALSSELGEIFKDFEVYVPLKGGLMERQATEDRRESNTERYLSSDDASTTREVSVFCSQGES